MPTSPFTPPALSGYNSSPPVDDGTVEAANQVKWSTIKTKLTDPIRTLAAALEAGGAVATAFGKTFNTDPGELNRLAGILGFTSASLTIASGAVTQTRGLHLIDTEASAATDDLDKVVPIASAAAGDLLILGQVASGRAVTVKNASVVADGAFVLDGTDFTIGENGRILFILTGSVGSFRWIELSRSSSPASAPRGYLAGLTLSNNGTDPTNDIDIAVGVARDGGNTDTLTLGTALTKQLDAAWAVGSGVGGLDTGSIANDVYHMWLIKRPDTGVVDVLFSASATAPTMPASYTLKRRIGAVIRSAGALLAFKQYGDQFLLKTPILDINAANPGTAAVLRTLTVPDGIQVEAIVNLVINSGTSFDIVAYLSSPDVNDAAPSVSAAPLGQLSTDNGPNSEFTPATQVRCFTSTSAQIRSRLSASGAADDILIATMGWIDTRGRFD